MSRIILSSFNTAVILADSPAFKTVDESGWLFSSVQSMSFDFSTERQRLKQIGSQKLAVSDFVKHPDVNLNLSYIYSPTFANEGG